MKVLYKKRSYYVSFFDAVHIFGLKVLLRIKRQIRRIRNNVYGRDILLYFFVIVLWLLYALAIFILQRIKNTGFTTYLDIIWDIKTPLFTTVVIALFTTVFSRTRSYTKTLCRQHDTYVNAQSDFCRLLDPFLPNRYRFIPMYTEYCFDQSMSYIIENGIFDNSAIPFEMTRILENRLNIIESELRSNNLFFADRPMLELYLDDAKEALLSPNVFLSIHSYKSLLWKLFQILEELRKPWRLDHKIDTQIISMLNKNPKNKIEDDFYKRMFVPNYVDDLLCSESVLCIL